MYAYFHTTLYVYEMIGTFFLPAHKQDLSLVILQTYKIVLHLLQSRKHSNLVDWNRESFKQFMDDVLAMIDLYTIYKMCISAYVRNKYQAFIFHLNSVL